MSGCIYKPSMSLFPQPAPLKEKVIEGKGENKVLLIDISGFISAQAGKGMVSTPSMVARVKEELRRASENKMIKAVVLRINSPGGTITGSDIIYHELLRYKEKTGNKVIASIGSIGTSGAYYISMAADKVVANPTAVTGSIGVIMVHVNFQGLMEKIGVGAEAVKSGKNKDLGSPAKPLSSEGRQILQGVIDSMQARFLDVISIGRPGLSPEEIRIRADGRIFTANEALSFGLIDRISYLDEAIELAKLEAGIDEAKVIVYSRPHEYKDNIYSRSFLSKSLSGLSPPFPPLSVFGFQAGHPLDGGSPKFLYLWMP
ncbi:MAG TPA: signal peptide peptidase SppA [Nitrospiria bacterium]|nr:signal peptide peptidase SppA [Candidatus Manganitrophaceae bacterium]HIL34628.1 signal peptide peptidase SppA [Candidatus Manganitrophaceae bacterium]